MYSKITVRLVNIDYCNIKSSLKTIKRMQANINAESDSETMSWVQSKARSNKSSQTN